MTLRLTTEAPSGLTYHYNDDFSGGVHVTLPMGRTMGYTNETDHGVISIDASSHKALVEIPFADLRHLVLQGARDHLVSEINKADDATLVRLLAALTPGVPDEEDEEDEEKDICGKNPTPGFANPPCPLDEDHDGGCVTL